MEIKEPFELPDIKGRAIWATGNTFTEIQAPFISDEDLEEALLAIEDGYRKKQKYQQKIIPGNINEVYGHQKEPRDDFSMESQKVNKTIQKRFPQKEKRFCMKSEESEIVRITPRDINLFSFLFQYKVGTLKQLAKYPFHGASYESTSIRVSLLKRTGYVVKRLFDGGPSWRSLYSLTDKSLDLIKEIIPYRLVRHQKTSNHPNHDIELLEIGEWLRNSSPVERFLTENTLQCCEEFTHSNQYMDFSRIKSDAAFVKLKSGEKTLNWLSNMNPF